MLRNWVKDYFKHILIESCKEYLCSSNKGKDKIRMKLSETVAEQIHEAVREHGEQGDVREGLEQVCNFPPHALIFYIDNMAGYQSLVAK